jgi:class 3 adenylate cyclase
MLMDRSIPGLSEEIQKSVDLVEPLASYLPAPILNLLVECAAQRQIPPAFPTPTVVFINLMGLPEAVDLASPDEVDLLVRRYSQAFALIHASVRSRGGILQKVTYHSLGSDMLVYFGALGSHPEDALRAADMALEVRQIVRQLAPPRSAGQPVDIACRIGLDQGPVFAAEIGSPRARREFNILGDPVNTAARLMTLASSGQILLTESVYRAIAPHYPCTPIGDLFLKGKTTPQPTFELESP